MIPRPQLALHMYNRGSSGSKLGAKTLLSGLPVQNLPDGLEVLSLAVLVLEARMIC
jgi:hypothetical protein